MLLEDSLDFTPLVVKPLDAELLSSKFSSRRCLQVLPRTLHLVNELSRSTNNNIEHQSLEFVMYTMLPHYKRFESGINTWLLTKSNAKRAIISNTTWQDCSVAMLKAWPKRSQSAANGAGYLLMISVGC